MTSPVTAGAAQPYMQTHVLSDSAIKPLTRSKSSNHSKPFSGCQWPATCLPSSLHHIYFSQNLLHRRLRDHRVWKAERNSMKSSSGASPLWRTSDNQSVNGWRKPLTASPRGLGVLVVDWGSTGCSILEGAELDERGQSQVQKNPAREKYKKKRRD